MWKDLARDFILALHSSRQVVLWNADTGDRIWMHTYQVPVFSFDLNPHNPSNVACKFSLSFSFNALVSSTGNSLLLVEDMSLHPAPSSSGHFLRLPIDVSTSADSSAIVSLRFNPAFTNLLFVACRDQVTSFFFSFVVRCLLWKRSRESSCEASPSKAPLCSPCCPLLSETFFTSYNLVDFRLFVLWLSKATKSEEKGGLPFLVSSLLIHFGLLLS